jgi:hypothetical protein
VLHPSGPESSEPKGVLVRSNQRTSKPHERRKPRGEPRCFDAQAPLRTWKMEVDVERLGRRGWRSRDSRTKNLDGFPSSRQAPGRLRSRVHEATIAAEPGGEGLLSPNRMYRYISMVVSAIWWAIDILWGRGIQGKASGLQNRKRSFLRHWRVGHVAAAGINWDPACLVASWVSKAGHPSPATLEPKSLKLMFGMRNPPRRTGSISGRQTASPSHLTSCRSHQWSATGATPHPTPTHRACI